MCGIVGYIGKQEATPIIIEGLRRLEYRGYDSAGLVVLRENDLQTRKKKGTIDEGVGVSPARDHRHWPYPLGYPWSAHR